MYTTIEPRLIALLNTDISIEHYSNANSPSLELPPLHDPNILKASGRPLLLEPDTSTRNGKPSANSKLASQHPTLISGLDEADDKTHDRNKSGVDRTLGNWSPQSLRKILGDDIGEAATSSKKRNIVESNKDDFVQLPQPPKKQKAAKQVVPPIIIGLFEPPPQAALFPPIAPSSFHDSHGRNSLNTVPPKVKELDKSRKSEHPATFEERTIGCKDEHVPRRDVKARKKWTEEETNNLLLGVKKHGVGSWMGILDDPVFWFNGRSGVDLKDRFRTCCPEELCERSSKGKSGAMQIREHASKIWHSENIKSSLKTENILIDHGGDADTVPENGFLTKVRRSRSHRKKLEDLAQLGIERPFFKSQRRDRKPFSEQDDHEILMGYDMYGPAWTRILKDRRFHLQSRTATDLRDRLRNKYPDKFRSDESKESREVAKEAHKAEPREKETSALNQPRSLLQPSSSRERLRIQQIISSESKLEKMPSKNLPSKSLLVNDNFGAFPEQPIESTDGLPFTQSFDWGNSSLTAPFPGNIGEMDVSRLLLDESWIDSSGKEKSSFTESNSIIISSSDSLPQVTSFLNMLVSDEQMNIPPSDTSFG